MKEAKIRLRSGAAKQKDSFESDKISIIIKPQMELGKKMYC